MLQQVQKKLKVFFKKCNQVVRITQLFNQLKIILLLTEYIYFYETDVKKDVVIKAQVLSGGRGLGTFKNGFKGGVHMCTQSGQAAEFAKNMLGEELVTKQAPNGIICNKVFLMERMYMRREMYLSILMDRGSQGPLMVGSPFGGTSIEDVAASNPDAIFTESIDITKGLQPEQCERMALNLGLEPGSSSYTNAVDLMKNLYSMFMANDCTQVEVNPLAETPDGDVVVCDAKINFDDNAAYRQKSVFEKRDTSQEGKIKEKVFYLFYFFKEEYQNLII